MNRKEQGGRIVFVGLMPHAPVLIPEVGCGQEREAISTVNAMRRLSEAALACNPDTLLLISPHSPRQPGAFGIWRDARLVGDLSRFRSPQVTLNLPNAPDLTCELEAAARRHGLSTWSIIGRELDHGAIVPLYFLTRAGWSGPTAVISLNYPGEGGHARMSAAIGDVIASCSRRAAIIASGDMSHALKPGGPAGYQARAADFDRTVVDLLKAGSYRELASIDPKLQDLAAEDVLDSTLIAAGSVDWSNRGRSFLSYEGPFGVGYSVATLYQDAET